MYADYKPGDLVKPTNKLGTNVWLFKSINLINIGDRLQEPSWKTPKKTFENQIAEVLLADSTGVWLWWPTFKGYNALPYMCVQSANK